MNKPARNPPGLLSLLREVRLPLELVAMARSRNPGAKLPQGDGHPVIVLPGFYASDRTITPLVRRLSAMGYDASGWGLGRNAGIRPGLRDALSDMLERRTAHEPASLIGWSLGGVFARELAKAQPARVRQVITLGSPFAGHPASNNLNTLFKLVTGKDGARDIDWDKVRQRAEPPPVPCTAIHSKSDGIVAWECSVEPDAPHTRNIEVSSSHFGLPFNPAVLAHLADLLAEPPPRRAD